MTSTDTTYTTPLLIAHGDGCCRAARTAIHSIPTVMTAPIAWLSEFSTSSRLV